MKVWRSPAQQSAMLAQLAEAEAYRHRQARRRWLAGAALLLGSSGVGFFAGALTSPSSPDGSRDAGSGDAGPEQEDQGVAIQWARQLADDRSELQPLVNSASTFLQVIARDAPDDPALWHGAHRIGLALLERPTDLVIPHPRALCAALVQTLESHPHPVEVARLLPGLRRLLANK